METELAFFRRRASEEYLAYANAGLSAAREKHLELARRYESLALSINNGELGRTGDPAGDAKLNRTTEDNRIERASLWL